MVETETGETDGRDWGSGDDVTVAVEEGERWRERERRLHLMECNEATSTCTLTVYTAYPPPQDSPAGVVETDIELLVHGSDVEDAMIAVERRG